MTAQPTVQDLLTCAIAAVRAATRHALDNRHRRAEVVGTYKHDVKLKLDIECQGVAENVIRASFPSHTVLGEEDGDRADGEDGHAEPDPDVASPYLWIIDPIDGTVNFSHGLRQWCCAIAVMRGERMLAGAVCAPEMDELFAAAEGHPATRNGDPIRVSATPELSRALVMTGLDKQAAPQSPPLAFFSRITEHCQKTRVMGCAALDMCQVACGRADGYFESGIYIWDVAAAGLIVQQAGGTAEVLRRLPHHRMHFLATNGLIHAELRRLVG